MRRIKNTAVGLAALLISTLAVPVQAVPFTFDFEVDPGLDNALIGPSYHGFDFSGGPGNVLDFFDVSSNAHGPAHSGAFVMLNNIRNESDVVIRRVGGRQFDLIDLYVLAHDFAMVGAVEGYRGGALVGSVGFSANSPGAVSDWTQVVTNFLDIDEIVISGASTTPAQPGGLQIDDMTVNVDEPVTAALLALALLGVRARRSVLA